jgi:hypothetical protein
MTEPQTRWFSDTVRKRMEHDPAFREAMKEEIASAETDRIAAEKLHIILSNAAVEPLVDRLIQASVGGCSCHTKSPELKWHDPLCHFRLFSECIEVIARMDYEMGTPEAYPDIYACCRATSR